MKLNGRPTMKRYGVKDIRDEFANLYETKTFVIDKTGAKVVEIIGGSFVANEDQIFGTPNSDWNSRELTWYQSMSLNVNDIPPPIPAIWKAVATPEGMINSNYGWAVWSEANHNQYLNVFHELKKNPFSRRAQMIYTRPTMWKDYNVDGRSDFMCTTATQHFIRNDELTSYVTMRSNDAVYGYKGDLHWQQHVHCMLADELHVNPGPILWDVGSLHVYERHFPLIEEYIKNSK